MSQSRFLLSAMLCVASVFSCVSVASADAQQDKLDAALVKAVNRSKTAEVRALLRKGANANTLGQDAHDEEYNAKESVLKIAVENGAFSIAQMLLWRGANAKSGDYQTSAFVAYGWLQKHSVDQAADQVWC